MDTLTITATAPCEHGQCGGDVILVTDRLTLAYAASYPTAPGFVGQDVEHIARSADGSIRVTCSAVHALSEETCSGWATFPAARLANEPAMATPHAELMIPMEMDA